MGEIARGHRTMLEALRIERGLGWGEVRRLIDDAGVSISEDHIRRLGTGSRSNVSTKLAGALERAFGLPGDLLLGPYDPALLPQQAPGITTHQDTLAAAARRARTIGLDMPRLDTFDVLEDEVRDLARAYPVRPLTELINPLVSLQDSAHEALTRPHADGRRLYAINAVVGGMLAKASHDLGDPRSAMAQIRTARLFADQVGHVQLVGWLDGLAALVAYWDDRPRESLEAAHRGLAAGATGSTALWLQVSAARAWAKLGNVEQVERTAEYADRTLQALTPGELDDMGGMLTFGPARAAYYLADAYAWLPTHPDGELVASAAVEAYTDPTHPEWAFGDAAGSACDLAIVRLGHGDIDGATDALSPVLQLPREERIGGIIKSVRRVGTALQRIEPGARRDALQEQVEAFVAQPLVMQP